MMPVIQGINMEQHEVEDRLKAALVKMHVYEHQYNKIAYAHTKEGLEKIIQCAPCDEKDMKAMLKISLCISMRYVEEYLTGFRAHGIIFREDGMIYLEKPVKKEISYSVNKDNEVIKTEKGRCKYDIEKHGMCEKLGIIKSKQACENCEGVILLA
jgi:hypothetical protein